MEILKNILKLLFEVPGQLLKKWFGDYRNFLIVMMFAVILFILFLFTLSEWTRWITTVVLIFLCLWQEIVFSFITWRMLNHEDEMDWRWIPIMIPTNILFFFIMLYANKITYFIGYGVWLDFHFERVLREILKFFTPWWW